MNHQPRKRFGQNFLVDQHILESMRAAIHATETDHLVEIGPGMGALTRRLTEDCKKLDVIEIDRDLCAHLKLTFNDAITIHEQDALHFDFSKLSTERFRVIGNLPYNISTPILFHLMRFLPKIEDLHFLLQKEVVDRITATPNNKNYGRLSVMIQYHCQTDFLFDVGRHAFKPAPKVESAFFCLTPHQDLPHKAKNFETFHNIVRECFNHRRKTLRKTLKTLYDLTALETVIDLSLRPENLSVADFVRLSNHV